jgi:flagellar L-ring protein FlgH
MKRLILFLMLLSMAGGCAHPVPTSTFPAREQRLEKPGVTYVNGSLWQSSSGSLLDDMKARRVGDTLTVVVSEQTSASKAATTGTGRSGSVAAGIPTLMGLEAKMLANGMDPTKLMSASTDTKYSGTGTTTRNDALTATMTARVMEILPNGNLLIEGRRNVMVNNEDQMIVLEGTVRPRDITPDNTITSALIADARITYSGNGVISDRQRPGWLMNIVDVIWPF